MHKGMSKEIGEEGAVLEHASGDEIGLAVWEEVIAEVAGSDLDLLPVLPQPLDVLFQNHLHSLTQVKQRSTQVKSN